MNVCGGGLVCFRWPRTRGTTPNAGHADGGRLTTTTTTGTRDGRVDDDVDDGAGGRGNGGRRDLRRPAQKGRAGRGPVRRHRAAQGVLQERGVAGCHPAVRRPGRAGGRATGRAAARLDDTHRLPGRQLFVDVRPAQGVRAARDMR